MLHYGITVNASYRFPGLYDLESGYKAMQQFLALDDRPTAVFCCNDEMALGAMKATSEAGMQVPRDVSIIGFDDTLFAAYVTPALTTVRRPIEKISTEGAIRLLCNIENKQYETEQVLLKTELIVRESVRSLSSR
jgi:DNA-binding LacI/PurR family transcriptional regulator